ncbi:methyltransferase domain-containing protein [SAR116 cluster bacterium]|jgi:ubiquinone/menaquinone biosynthesis C-methylase UbiE|nr:methyltransferase domain-containing protein [SAR116 cluster bacterium]|tara:strand:- start:2654 stop:3286 length:633 start_codon:yes stop_codon:yes gene_type:complete
MSSKKGLNDAYSVKTPEDNIKLYKVWASSYDDDFAKKNDYRSPVLISNYYDKYSNKNDVPVLDVGAGTGLIAEVMNKKNTIDIDAIDISPEMLESAKSKNCYNKLIEADLTKNLDIDNNYYGAIVSAGTFTHGHIGPNALDELLRVTKPSGLFVITIHSKVYVNQNFEQKFQDINEQITDLTFHEEKAYGNNPDKDHGNDTVFITVFRKK